MISKRITGLTLIGALLLPISSIAYEVETHKDISKAAVFSSALNDQNKLNDLGLRHAVRGVDDKVVLGGNSIVDWIRFGAEREDDIFSYLTFARFTNHFYDPLHTSAADNFGGLVHGLLRGIPSPAWGLKDDPNVPVTSPEQIYSYKDGRDYFYRALTAPSGRERLQNYALTFRTLGHVMHLIQDTAQPQHTRNDSHGGIPGTGPSSLYEKFTRDIGPTQLRGTGAVSFPRVRGFWANDQGTGMAQFSNRNYVTTGTNFRIFQGVPAANARYASPRPDNPNQGTTMSVQDAYAQLGQALTTDIANFCPQPTDCMLTFVSSTADVPVAKAATLSIFDQDIRLRPDPIPYTDGATGQFYQVDRIFSLNRLNFLEAHQHLIPRAVAYSAGLINYFFRGQMQISLPDEGIYGIVDQGQTGTTGGFTTIKLKIQNTTPDPTGQPGVIEPMTAGQGVLLAVAKFHRNKCYRLDLSGELGSTGLVPPDETPQKCPSTEEEIVASSPAAVPTEINAAPSPVTFTFPTPIPVSATDLFLQVVYRGSLGQESDAVVVATKDIAEPTFVGFYDNTEQFTYGSLSNLKSWKSLYCDELNPALSYEECRVKYAYSVHLRFAAPVGYDPNRPIETFNPIASIIDLPISAYARTAILADTAPYRTYLLLSYSQGSVYTYDFGPYDPAMNQKDAATGVLVPTVYQMARGIFADPRGVEIMSFGDDGAKPFPAMSPATPKPAQINF